jgi:hypothetical protein
MDVTLRMPRRGGIRHATGFWPDFVLRRPMEGCRMSEALVTLAW